MSPERMGATLDTETSLYASATRRARTHWAIWWRCSLVTGRCEHGFVHALPSGATLLSRGMAGHFNSVLEIVQRAERFFHVRRSQNHEPGWRFRCAGEVGVLDVDARLGQPFGDRGERAGFVVAFDHQDIVLESEHAPFAEDHEGLGRVAHDHADDGVIDRVGGGEGVNVDLRGGKLGTDAREGTWPVAEEDGELCGGLDLNLRIHNG